MHMMRQDEAASKQDYHSSLTLRPHSGFLHRAAQTIWGLGCSQTRLLCADTASDCPDQPSPSMSGRKAMHLSSLAG